MTNPTVVSASDPVTNAAGLEITLTIQQDGAAKDLTGVTTTATVRRESAQSTVIDATLEDHATSVVGAATDGVVTLTLTASEMANLAVPTDVRAAYPYLVQLKCDDGFYPQLYRIYVHGVLD